MRRRNLTKIGTASLSSSVEKKPHDDKGMRFLDSNWVSKQEEKYNTFSKLLFDIQNKSDEARKAAAAEIEKTVETAKLAAMARIATRGSADLGNEMDTELAERIKSMINRNSKYGFNMIDSENHVNMMRGILYNAFLTNKNIRFGNPDLRSTLSDNFDEHIAYRIKQIQQQKESYLKDIEDLQKKIGEVLLKIDRLDEVLEKRIPESLGRATSDDLALLDATVLDPYKRY